MLILPSPVNARKRLMGFWCRSVKLFLCSCHMRAVVDYWEHGASADEPGRRNTRKLSELRHFARAKKRLHRHRILLRFSFRTGILSYGVSAPC